MPKSQDRNLSGFFGQDFYRTCARTTVWRKLFSRLFRPQTQANKRKQISRKALLFSARKSGCAKIGEGQKEKNVRKCHDKPVPFPSNPIWSEAPHRPSHECLLKYGKKGKLAREVRGSKDETNGRERTLCHDIFCPVPFPPSPSDLHRKTLVIFLSDFRNRNKTRDLKSQNAI